MTRTAQTQRALTFLEALAFPALVALYIWRWQVAFPLSWVIFPIWLVASFLLHRDTPKTLGWRSDNLWPATRQGLWMYAAFIATIAIAGIALGALHRTPQHLLDRQRLVGYFAFCLLQQVAVNSYLMNRFLFATSTPSLSESTPLSAASTAVPDPTAQERPIIAAALSSFVFGALHWPNPVLVPVTLIGGFGMCLLLRAPAQHPSTHARPSHPRRPNLVGLPHRLAPLHARRPRLLLLRPPPRKLVTSQFQQKKAMSS